jgi:predicted metal-dependent hydrolase
MVSNKNSDYVINSDIIHLKYGSADLSIRLFLAKKKHLSITVFPDGEIVAKAPQAGSLEEITNRLRRRAGWMVRQLDYYRHFHPIQPERQYLSGETHFFLGRQYRLKIEEGKPEQVKLIGGYIRVQTDQIGNRARIRRLVGTWYSSHAKHLFLRHLEAKLPRFVKLGASQPMVRIQRMQKRWGSCIGKKSILLNTELIKAPLHCIDYVIIHELCHLVHPKHDKDFYQLLSRILPDWKERKKRLEMVMI